MDAYIFIDKMAFYACSEMNYHDKGFGFCEKATNGDVVAMIIKENLLDGTQFCGNKFSRFFLDDTKSLSFPIVLKELENNGMELHYCWTNAEYPLSGMTRKEKVVSYLIEIQEIITFNHLLDAFKPNGLNLN